MVLCAEKEKKKQAIRDALLHSIYARRDESSIEGNNGAAVPFYSWTTETTANCEDTGALEMLARSINQPGTTQDAGVVLAVDHRTGRVKTCSPNTTKYFDLNVNDVLGSMASSLFTCQEEEFKAIIELEELAPRTMRMQLAKRGTFVEATFCRSEDGMMIDVEEELEAESTDFDLHAAETTAANAAATVANIEDQRELGLWIVCTIQDLMGFDRVKLYQFHPDQHGEVLFEALRPGCALESCQGLHYPATDIPQRARDLFLLNHVRFIKDTHQPPLPLSVIGDTTETASSVYLTSSCLRGVHPVHMEYLRNMKVTASLTFAIIVKGRLWGLVACHHGSGPRMVPRSMRNLGWKITQAFNARLAELLLREREARLEEVEGVKERLVEMLRNSVRPEVFARSMDVFKGAVECDGCALVAKSCLYTSGSVPCDRVLQSLVAQSAHELRTSGCLAIDSISKHFGLATEDCAGAAGVLVAKVSNDLHLLWLRNEFIREVKWGADDNRDGTPNLFGARESFQQWTQEVAGECKPWTAVNCEDAVSIAHFVAERSIAMSKTAEFVTDLAGTVVLWNEAMATLSGMQQDLAVGKRLSDLCYHCDQAEVQRRLDGVSKWRSNASSRIELKIRTQPDPEPAAFLALKTTNARGSAVLHFRTEHESAPQEAESEVAIEVPMLRRWKVGGAFAVPSDFNVLDEVNTPFFIVDANPASRTFLWSNEETCRVLKLTKSQFYCLDLRQDLVDKRVLQQWYESAQVKHHAVRGSHHFYTDNHSVLLDVEVAPINVKTATGTHTVCFVSARAPEQTSQPDPPTKRAAEMTQAAKAMMMMFNQNGRMLYSNLSATVYYSTATASGTVTLRDVFESCVWGSHKECEEAYADMLHVCEQGNGKVFEMERVKKDPQQEDVVHLIQCFACRDPEDGSLCFAVHETNVSRLRSVRKELRAAKEREEKVLASVSHELRTPVHGILALSSSLLKDTGMEPAAVRMLKLIHSSGTQLADLVDHILDAAAMQQGALVLRREAVQLRSIAEHVLDVCGRLAANGVELVNDVPSDLGSVQGDAGRLTQVFMNLIGNSVKFTKKGHIKVSAKADEANDQVCIQVEDTGRGIPTDKQKMIWEPFSQAEAGAGGTGLGLSIVQRLVSAMGGAVSVKSPASDNSEAEQGTVFTIVIPRCPGSGSSAASSLSQGEKKWTTEWDRKDSVSTGTETAATPQEVERLQQQLEEVQERMLEQERELERLRGQLQLWDQAASGQGEGGLSPQRLLTMNRSEDGIYIGRSAPCGATRALEILGYSVRFLSIAEAQSTVDEVQELPAFVLLDAEGLGSELRAACRWARGLKDVPVVLVAGGEAGRSEAVALGCTGRVSFPLEVQELGRELRLQKDVRELWACAHALRSPPLAPEAIAERTRELVEASETVKEHTSVGAVCLSIKVECVAEETTTAEAQSLRQLIKRLHEIAAAVAGENGALVTEVAVDRITLATGVGAEERKSLETVLVTAHRLAVRVMEAVREHEWVFLEFGQQVSIRAGIDGGKGFEGLVGCDLEHLAFFGSPFSQAAKIAAITADGCVGMSAQSFALLYPAMQSESAFCEADVYFFALQDRTWTSRIVAPGNILGKIKKVRQPSEGAEDQLSTREVWTGAREQALSYVEFASSTFAMLTATDAERRVLDPHSSLMTRVDLKLASRLLGSSASGGSQTKMVAAPQLWKTPSLDHRRSSRARLPAQLHSVPHEPQQVTVLSVDDNPVNQVVIESALVPLGYKVITCMDTPEAFEVLEGLEQLPDIILLDVMLPTESGVEALKRLRQTYSQTELPIVLVSGKSSKASVIEGLEAGGNDYVVKPFDTAELVARVQTQLGVSSKVKIDVELARQSELINKMLPPEIAPRVLAGETPVHHNFDLLSVMVVEVVGHEEMAKKMRPAELITLLTGLYSQFDDLCDKYSMFKVETEPFTYVVACCDNQEAGQASRLVQMGLSMIRETRSFVNVVTDNALEIRVGVNCGPASAGVISSKLPHYCLFGDTINVARQMQLNCFPSTVTLSPDSMALIQDHFPCASLGVRVIASDGPMETFVVKDRLCPWEDALAWAERCNNFVARTTEAGPMVAEALEAFVEHAAALSPCGALAPYTAAQSSSTRDSRRGSGSSKAAFNPANRTGSQPESQGPPSVISSQDLPQPSTEHPSPTHNKAGAAQAGSGELDAAASALRGTRALEDPMEDLLQRATRPEGTPIGSDGLLTQPRRDERPDPVEEVLRRANLLDKREALQREGVDVEMLAFSEQSQLLAFDIVSKGDMFRVRHYARAWITLYGLSR